MGPHKRSEGHYQQLLLPRKFRCGLKHASHLFSFQKKGEKKSIPKNPRCVPGWYWGAVTAAQAHAALQQASEGAFLVRDSSHPLYMLTLSVRTARGPTSIRIQYSCAQFLLDSSSPARPSLSSFPNVPSLVQHYMGPERKAEEGKVEEEPPSKASQQGIQETTVVLKLKQALYKPQSLPSLQHLTRLVINRQTDCPDQLPLPRPLLRYLQDYPFKV
ncbi:unnamed protein product [Oreochromis niloticus]|nr:unnamed protein product [Mustela putorius furo]